MGHVTHRSRTVAGAGPDCLPVVYPPTLLDVTPTSPLNDVDAVPAAANDAAAAAAADDDDDEACSAAARPQL